MSKSGEKDHAPGAVRRTSLHPLVLPSCRSNLPSKPITMMRMPMITTRQAIHHYGHLQHAPKKAPARLDRRTSGGGPRIRCWGRWKISITCATVLSSTTLPSPGEPDPLVVHYFASILCITTFLFCIQSVNILSMKRKIRNVSQSNIFKISHNQNQNQNKRKIIDNQWKTVRKNKEYHRIFSFSRDTHFSVAVVDFFLPDHLDHTNHHHLGFCCSCLTLIIICRQPRNLFQ